MRNKKSKLLLITFLLSVFYSVNAQRSDRFSGGTYSNTSTTILGGNNYPDKTKDLINAIAALPASGGKIKIRGRLTLGTIGINRDNVHLDIAKGTEIKLSNSKLVMFKIGSINNADNIRIYCSECSDDVADNSNRNERYSILYEKQPDERVAFIIMNDISNFQISHFIVKDNFTGINAIAIRPITQGTGANIKVKARATKGDIKYGHIEKAHSGYGLVQVQTAGNMNFHHLSGEGGVILRLESGAAVALVQPKNATPESTIDNVEGYDLTSKGSWSTVSFSPHTVTNGKVVLEDIRAIGSLSTLRIVGGFIDRNLPKGHEHKYRKGKFTNVILKGTIENIYKKDQAQLERRDYVYYPKALRDMNPFDLSFGTPLFKGDGGVTDRIKVDAPSITTILFLAKNSSTAPLQAGNYDVNMSAATIKNKGFLKCIPSIIYKDDKNKICPGAQRSAQSGYNFGNSSFEKNENPYSVQFNNATKEINVQVIDNAEITILNLSGVVVKEGTLNSGVTTIQGADLPNGMYIVNLKLDGKLYNSKIVL